MKNSIYYKIFVIFAVALLFVALLFTFIGHTQHENALKKAESTQLSAITYLISLYDKNRPPQDLKRFFSNFNMEIVNDKGKIIEITNQGREIFKQHTILGAFVSVEFKDALYLFIVNETFSVGFESLDTKNVTDPAWLGFFITFGLLIWLYYSVIKSLLPLKKLNNNQVIPFKYPWRMWQLRFKGLSLTCLRSIPWLPQRNIISKKLPAETSIS